MHRFHWNARSQHADFGGAQVHTCQPALMRQSSRLLQLVHDFYASGSWAFCEMVAPSLAAGWGWRIASLQQLAPKLFGTFEWSATITAGAFRGHTVADAAREHGRLYHRLKF